MKGLIGLARSVNDVVFGLLALVAWVRFVSTRGRAEGWLAATFSSLAVVVVGSEIADALGAGPGVRRPLVCALVAFPLCLLGFLNALEPAKKALIWAASLLTGVLLLATLALPSLDLLGPRPPVWAVAYVAGVLVQWVGIGSYVAFRLLRAAAAQPAVVRSRLRLLGTGAAVLSFALLAGVVLSNVGGLAVAVPELLAALGGIAFFGGFAPPVWLRALWRLEEEQAVRRATLTLMGATSPKEVVDSLLPHLPPLVGGRAAALIGRDGQVLGSVGEGIEPEVRGLAAGADPPAGVLCLDLPFGRLCVWGSPYAAAFGRHEIELVQSLGVLAGIALERAELFARERRARRELEAVNVQLRATAAELEQEVADRRRAEEELIESQVQLAEAQELTMLGSFSLDLETGRVMWSDQMFRILGLPEGSGASLEAFEALIHPEDLGAYRDAVRRLNEGENRVSLDYRVVRPDGQVRVLHARAKAVRDISGNAVKVIGTAQDVTTRWQNDQALKASEARFRSLAQSTTEAIVTIDEQGIVRFWNRGAVRVFGYWEDEIVGRPVETIIPEQYRAAHRAGLRRARETGEGRLLGSTVELEGLRKDGSVFPVELSLSTWTTPEGRFFAAILRDVSERRRMEDELRRTAKRMQLVLDSAGEGVYELDQQGRIRYVNAAGAAMLGYEPAELVGQRSHDLVHYARPDGSPYPYGECAILDVARRGVTVRRSDEVYWRKDGTSFPVEYVATPLVDAGEIVGTVVVFSDITERVAYERSVRAGVARRELLGLADAELRAPLASIRRTLSLIAEGVLGPLPEPARPLAEAAGRDAERVVRLLGGLLDVERIESGEVPVLPEDVPVVRIVEDARAALDTELAGRDVEVVVEVEEGLRARADPTLATEALGRVLAAAVDALTAGGRVWLRATGREGAVLVEVCDDGPALSPSQLASLFEPATGPRPRAGLGLAVARALIAAQGGRMWAEARPEGGVCVRAELPRAAARGAAGVVLVVDPAGSRRAAAASVLRAAGSAVVSTPAGEEALELTRRHLPSAVVVGEGADARALFAGLGDRGLTPAVVLLGAAAGPERGDAARVSSVDELAEAVSGRLGARDAREV